MAEIIRSMPMADYLASPAADNTYLGHLQRSPAHAQWEQSNHKASAAMALGSLVHTMILEPAEVGRRYAVAPKCDKRTKEGKEVYALFVEASAGKEVVSNEDFDRVRAMAAAVSNHPAAAAVLAGATDRELSIFWTDEQTGLPCKARLDLVSQLGGLLLAVDLKTTRSADRDDFSRSIYTYGYHRQASFYAEAAHQAGFDVAAFAFVCVESDEPHGVAAYRIDDAALEEGRTSWRRLLAVEAECRKSGRWPGYPDEVQTITLPPWAFTRSSGSFTGEIRF